MKTKRDFWRLIGLSYLLIFSGIILLYIIEENTRLTLFESKIIPKDIYFVGYQSKLAKKLVRDINTAKKILKM